MNESNDAPNKTTQQWGKAVKKRRNEQNLNDEHVHEGVIQNKKRLTLLYKVMGGERERRHVIR